MVADSSDPTKVISWTADVFAWLQSPDQWHAVRCTAGRWQA